MIRISLLPSLVAALSLLLTGCDWVDSTGVQNPPPPILLEEGQVIPLTEGATDTLDPGIGVEDGGNQQSFRWDDEPLQQGDIPGCAAIENFDRAYTAASLEQACARDDNCELYFEPQQVSDASGNRTVFAVSTPVLKAPVGVIYQLHKVSANGTESQSNFTFCLVATNDPPTATDDLFSVLEGDTLQIAAENVNFNLLSNDRDDVDVRNQDLRVLTTPVRAPVLADSFVLGTLGDFTYTPNPSITLSPGGSRTDSFVYTVTDGTNESSATVLISITASNAPPMQVEEIPEIVAIAGIEQSVVFSEYFNDPEGGELGYAIAQTMLPPSGNFTLSTAGVLSGIADEGDIASWPLAVSASDGADSAQADFILTVEDNEPPFAESIPAQSADLGDFLDLDVADYFDDPEDQPLSYTVNTVNTVTDASTSINRNTGNLRATFSRPGSFLFIVRGDDGYNPPVASSIRVTVAGTPNRSPVYSGSINNQVVEAGTPINPIQGNFSDPDNDALLFSVVGSLPAGISLNRFTGIVSGATSLTGAYPNLRIRATDPAGESATSDTFSITISAVVPNRRPVYSGSIPNQTVTLGNPVVPISGSFSDPDGDTLMYSIQGTLPAGMSLSPAGIISGIPTTLGGSSNLRLLATDPDDLAVRSDVFRITVVPPPPSINRSPVYTGFIANQTVDRGDTLVPISGTFSDPDGDVLNYSVVGRLPRGLAINSITGVISGAPRQAGEFRDLRIQAEDPDGLDARSDTFAIFVEPDSNGTE